MVLKFNFFLLKAEFIFSFPLHFPPIIFFRVGSGGINQDLWLFDQISLRVGSVAPCSDFSSGWDLSLLN